VERATPFDAAIMAALHQSCFPRPWDEAAMTTFIASPDTICLLASINDDSRRTPAGFLIARKAADEAELLTLAVAPQWRLAGLGRALLKSAMTTLGESGAKQLFLEVEDSNVAALRLYRSLGATAVGRLARYDEMPKFATAESRLERLCSEKGMRMTGQRRTIAKVLSEAEDHPDVEEVYRRASSRDPRISLSTVYRTVRLFEGAGILERHDFGDGRARYEPAGLGHHDHLINVKTGEVIEFSNEQIEKLQENVARELGFRLIGHRLELFGMPLKNGK
jgi:Fur family ferric uptake transcriptional regulator